MNYLRFKINYIRTRWPERFGLWLAYKLPRSLAMWAFIRVTAHASQGKYGATNPEELNVMEALKRWDTDNATDTPPPAVKLGKRIGTIID